MSMTNAAETALLTLIFNNTDWANVGDAAGLQNSAAAGSFYISLHTADPGETGSQTTSEATYTSYARVAVARSGAGWTISSANASNAAIINFPAATGGTNTITHFGIGSDSSGAGNLFFKGALTASLAVSSGITPSFAIGELDVNLD
ncbi:MAG: hypothetical protein V4657_11450 [Pseudomonadota bacterium]